MYSCSASSASNHNALPMPSSNPKDFSKKKRGNRSAKLKQCKLDARREQWLSQVKQKGGKEKTSLGSSDGPTKHANHTRGTLIEKLEIKSRGEEEIDGGSMNYSDSDSPSNSPTSHSSSILGGNGSGTTFTGSSSTRSSRSSSSCSGGCFSGSASEEDEEEDDECLDDWEAMADALTAAESNQEDHKDVSDSAPQNNNADSLDCHPEVTSGPVSGFDASQTKTPQKVSASCRAWRPDDAFRPQSLPNLSKQYSFPMNTEKRHGSGEAVWCYKNVASAPTSCPICCEDLDLTDSSFLPCLCGFRLCLFCHKRILEEDGRCPGCRKQYDHHLLEGETALDGGGNLTIRLARTCSLISRS